MKQLAAALGAVLVFASPAAAATSGAPVRFWSVSKVERGAGEVPITRGAQLGDTLEKRVDVGPVAFNFRDAPDFDRAGGQIFSSADGKHYWAAAQAPLPNPFQANSPEGTIAHLDEYQAYEKRVGDASLRIKITEAVMEAIDGNLRDECPPTVVRCWPLRSVVRFQARAYAASAGGDFFNVGGVAFIKGHHGLWDHWVATSADSQAPLWTSENFIFDPDLDDSDTFSDARMGMDRKPTLKVPLASVRTGELFAVHVSLEVDVVNARGGESAAQGYISDPQEPGPALLTAHGLTPRGKPRFKEPGIKAPKAARCPKGTPRNAGALQLTAPDFTASESDGDPLVLVTRTGGARGQRHRDHARRDRALRRRLPPEKHDRPLRRRRPLAAARRDPAARGRAGRATRDVHRGARPRALRQAGRRPQRRGHDPRRRRTARRGLT
jgi:hypothetical protein